MPKKPYMRPTFVKQMAGVMNKFGNSYYRSFRDNIDSVSIESLVETCGSPLFVFSERTLTARFHEIASAFSTRYPNVNMAWSYKTNYLDAVCCALHREGAMAEVVSDFEYDKARRLGITGTNIIVNGPCKPQSLLQRAFEEGAIVNIDNFDELYLAENIARHLKRKVKVGIRMTMDTGVYPQWNKFGFNYESGQAREAVSRLARSGNLVIAGLHTHIGTFILEPNGYLVATEKMVRFMQEVESSYGLTIEFLNLGGGFPSRNRLKGILLPPDVAVPSIDEYAEAICNALLRFLKPNEFPKLFIEAGRIVVDEAGYLISTIAGRKQFSDGSKGYVVDAGINLLYTTAWYNHSIQPDRQLSGIPEACRIYGPLCMNIDMISESVYLPPMPVGSRIVISPVGAYNISQWMQFITYRPAVVMIMADGTVELIRKAETLEDVIGCERIPEKYRKQQ